MTPTDQDDKTVITASTGVQNALSAEQDQNALPIGTQIAEFEITGLVGIGGFGVVYLARDDSLGRQVALKEYMPSVLARRIDGITVVPKSTRNAETFAAGLKSFINEARMLALFDHSALVKVYRFWEANGTAYMVMPYYQGRTLNSALSAMGSRPSEDWLKRLLAPLLDALEIVHEQHCLHRDIAPDNIFLLPNGNPVLLDFGAARQVIGDMVNNLTVILKPGYAPIEQYAGDPSMPQGAWTDIYALGAVMHFALTGTQPIVSVSRVLKDGYVPLEQSCAGHYSSGFLRAIDHMLAVRMDQRPKTIAELRKLLGVDRATLTAPEPKPILTNPGRRSSLKWAWVAAGVATIAMIVAVLLPNEKPATNLATQQPSSQQLPTLPPAAAPSASFTAASIPVTQSKPPPVFDALTLLNQVHQHSDPSHPVDVRIEKARLTIGRDNFGFRVRSTKGGYLYVLMLGTNHDLNLLFPNALDQRNQLKAGQELVLPGARWTMASAGPAGTSHFVAMVSDQPRDFTNAGFRMAGSFGEFPMTQLQERWKSNPDHTQLLSGVEKCTNRDVACSAAYGSTLFSIEEVVNQ